MERQYLYFLTALSDIKKQSDNELCTYEFDAIVEAGAYKGRNISRIRMFFEPSIELQDNIKSKKRFSMMLSPQQEGLFVSC